MSVSLIEAPVSFDQRLAGTADLTLLDAMEDTSTPPAPEAMDHGLLMENLHELFDKLLPFEADILRKRMGMVDGVESSSKKRPSKAAANGTGKLKKMPLEKLTEAVFAVLQSAKKPLSSTEIGAKVKAHRTTVRDLLHKCTCSPDPVVTAS